MAANLKPERKRRQSKEQALRNAYHGAGHAVVACVLGIDFKRVIALPVRGPGGHIEFESDVPPGWSEMDFRKQQSFLLRRDVLTMLAGLEAELLTAKRRHYGWIKHADVRSAMEVIKDYWSTEKKYVEKMAAAQALTTEIVWHPIIAPMIGTLANQLLHSDTMSGEEIKTQVVLLDVSKTFPILQGTFITKVERVFQ